MKKYNFNIMAVMAVVVLLCTAVHADVIYFKNGFSTEGQVVRTEEGIWVNGGLFSENDIERIVEDPKPEPKVQEKAANWMDVLFGKKEEPKTVERPRPSEITYTDKKPEPEPKVEKVQQKKETKDLGFFSGYADAITRAHQMQQEVEMRNQMIIREQMMAEFGTYDPAMIEGVNPYDQTESMKSNRSSDRSYDRSYKRKSRSKSRSSRDSYDDDSYKNSSSGSYRSKNVSPFSQGIKINKDGSADWR